MTSVAERVTRTESQTRVRRDAVPRKRRARRFSLRRVPFYFLIALIFVYTVFPFYWAIRSALTAQGDLFRTPVQYIPLDPTLDRAGDGRIAHPRSDAPVDPRLEPPARDGPDRARRGLPPRQAWEPPNER